MEKLACHAPRAHGKPYQSGEEFSRNKGQESTLVAEPFIVEPDE
jgi:hypothetical protein